MRRITLLMAVVLLGCSSAERGRRSRLAAGVRPVPASCAPESLATATPLPELTTLDLGYPQSTVDLLALRQLLYQRRYDTLGAVLAAYADSARRDYRMEYHLYDAYRSFDVADSTMRPFLDEWVRARPASAEALLARAHYFAEASFAARGADTRRNTSRKQFKSMDDYAELARRDIAASLEIQPCNLLAYHLAMMLTSQTANLDASRALLDEGMKIQPHGFLLPARHMYNLVPRWGGSYMDMRDFAEEMRPLGAVNPRMRALDGFALWDQARIRAREDDTTEALVLYERAFSMGGDYWQFRYDRGRYLYRIDRGVEALADLERAREQRPMHAGILDMLASTNYELGRLAPTRSAQADYFRAAVRDIALASRLDSIDSEVRSTRDFIRKNLPEYTPP